ncbi:MAG TPA: hypothetical protein VJ848_01845, partial [Candidatus Angelobacter sp.]|nr:hypothetical protein [Candidatus Angelobacter sp.]
GGPFIEFLLQFAVSLGGKHVNFGVHASMLHWQVRFAQSRHTDYMVEQPEQKRGASEALYCPNCACEVMDPLICGDCSAVICRVCGTPLESAADLGMG